MDKAVTRKQRRVSSVWIIPGLALLLGAWMLIDALVKADLTVEIRFETADGIEAGRTKVKTRNINIGVVDKVRLSDDHEGVIVSAKIERSARRLLRESSQFWVARPRIGLGGISGVGTILSGAYIVLEPGEGHREQLSFVGLESPPMTPPAAKGLRLRLFSESAGAIDVGDPVLYRGRQVGQVDAAEFEVEGARFRYDLFIKAPYDSLVSEATRFWKASSVQVEADADGISLSADSLQSILAGGIAFDLPRGSSPGKAIEDGARFVLHESRGDINRFPYRYYAEYLLFFHDSVRGLKAGAPVEYRGLQVGHVVDVSFSYFRDRSFLGSDEVPIPALIRIYPGHFHLDDTAEGLARMTELVRQHTASGLRAALQRGSLLTGNLYVGIDFYEEGDEQYAEAGADWGYEVFPTQSVGLEQIERRIVDILNTVDGLPLNELAGEVREAIAHARKMFDNSSGLIEGLDKLFAKEETQGLPERFETVLAAVEAAMKGVAPDSPLYADLEASLGKLNAALGDLQRLASKLERQPSSLIFSKPAPADPEPKASQ